MKLLGHLFAKDLRRLRWPLVAWITIVAARVAVIAAVSELVFADELLQLVVGDISPLLTMADTLVLVLLVSRLVHDEPLVGADAFWLTRPIPPKVLMAEKLAFAAAFLVAAPAISHAITVAVITRSVGDSVRVIPGFLFSEALWVAALIAIATLTPSLTRFLFAIAAGVLAIALAVAAMTSWLIMRADIIADGATVLPDMTTPIVAQWLLLGVALAVITSQYHTRRLRRAVLIGVAGIVLGLTAADAWPWRFARSAEPDPGAWARDERSVALVLDDDPPFVSDAFGFRRGMAKKQVAVPLRLAGVPPDYLVDSMSMRGRLELNGRTLLTAAGGMVTVRRVGVQRVRSHYDVMQTALGSTKLLQPAESDPYERWPIVLTLTDGDYEQYGRSPGRLTGAVNVSLRKWRVVGSMPLDEGATLRASSIRFEVHRLARRPDSCAILIREGWIATSQQPEGLRTYQFALRNMQRGEAVLGDSQPLIGGGLSVGSWSLFLSQAIAPATTAFVDLIGRFPSEGIGTRIQMDRAWLDGAELVVIESAYAGRVSRSLTVDRFQMRR